MEARTEKSYVTCLADTGGRKGFCNSGVMLWGAFSWRGKPSLAFISGTLNSPGYVNIFDENLLPFTEEKYPNGWRFSAGQRKSSHSKLHERVLYG